MRTFHLDRQEDETGVSGTGIVAEGVQFKDGTVAIRWMTETASTGVYASIDDVEVIHGHSGKTIIKWDLEDTEDDPYATFRQRIEKRLFEHLDDDGYEVRLGRCEHDIPLIGGQIAEGDLNVVIDVHLTSGYRNELSDMRQEVSDLFRRIGDVQLSMDPDHYASVSIWPIECRPEPEGFQTFTLHLFDQEHDQ